MEYGEERQHRRELSPFQDGTAEDEPDNEQSLQNFSLVDSLDTEESLGQNSESNANKITGPGPPCKDAGDTCYPCEENVCDKDKKSLEVKGSTFQNEFCRNEQDDETHSDSSSVIDLENCPILDLRELRTQRCEWPELTGNGEGEISLLQGTQNTEKESYNDIHSPEQDNGWNENNISVNHILVNHSLFSSSMSQTSGIEDHVHVSATSVHSLHSIHCESRDENLDLQSLELKNMQLQDPNNVDNEPLLSQISWCGDSLSTNDFIVSDPVQNRLESSISHPKGFKDVVHEEIFDSGFLFSNHQSISDDHSLCMYNSSVLSSFPISPFSLPSNRELFIYDVGKSRNEKKVIYNFHEEKNLSYTFSKSQHKFKDSEDRSSSHLMSNSSESFEDHNTFEDHSTSDDCNASEGNSSYDKNKFLQSSCTTVSNVSSSDNRVHHILFYIIHRTSSQKSIITFHDLEVSQEPQTRTLRSVACTFHRGQWLLYHLERLGFFRFHEITPMVFIVEPALNGLGRYFQQMEQGQPLTVLESMQYEWMRVRSFWSFPRNAGVSYLNLARLGFFYTGRVSETCCYSCGQIYKEWREEDDPLEIHRRISPHCPHLNEGDARNMPIYPDVVNQWPAIPWEPQPLLGEAAGPPVLGGPAGIPGAEASNRDTATVDTRSQHPSQKTNIAVHTTKDETSVKDNDSSSIGEQRDPNSMEIGREDLSQVLPRLPSLNSTPHPIAAAEAHTASAAEDPTLSGSSRSSLNEGASSRETGGSERAPPEDRPAQDQQQRADPNVQEQQQEPRGQDPPPNNNPPEQEYGRIIFPQNPPLNSAPNAAPRPNEEQVPRGVPRADPQVNYMPRYPDYAVQADRSNTFLRGWPAYLNQTPYEMSSAGFFFTGNGDYCRCFYCGGGLRNWEPGDDPWVEHARWFPRCLFVRQNKGERFIRLVQQRQENNRQNAPARQEPVLQPPPAQPPPVERNRLQGDASGQPNQQGQQSGEQTNTLTTTGQQSQQGATAGQNIENTESTALDEMSLSAVESLKVNGISSSRIKEALQIWKKQQKKAYKMSDVTSANLMQIIFDQEDEENRRLTETNQSASSLAQRSLIPVGGETSDGAGERFSAITSDDSTSNDPEMTEKLSLCKEAEEREKQLMCSVCGENEVTVAFLPCGHLVCCFQCAPAMIRCPNCREAVKGNVKVFLM